MNLAGGDCVEDLRRLEGDEGFCQVLRRAEHQGLKRRERREAERRWRKERRRTVPSASAVFRYLSSFMDWDGGALIDLPGRIVECSRELIIRLVKGHPAFDLLLEARGRIMALDRERMKCAHLEPTDLLEGAFI